MKTAIFFVSLAMTGAGASQPTVLQAGEADALAFSCLSQSQALFVAGIAAGTQSPNATAAEKLTQISNTCRSAHQSLSAEGHPCLPAIAGMEDLSLELANVYAGRTSIADADLSASDGKDGSSDHAEDETENGDLCEARLSALESQSQ
ncbi:MULTISPECIES: hypothetical protein [Brevundimonas]|uniref:hypothetical protein n=1 Tax=Brevundimonas TaxID=41275 RepID=UPI0012DE01D0|nr:hypothetical protein [Brevundimonas naejangsanensis]